MVMMRSGSLCLCVLVLSNMALQGSVAGSLSKQNLQAVKEKRVEAIKHQSLV